MASGSLGGLSALAPLGALGDSSLESNPSPAPDTQVVNPTVGSSSSLAASVTSGGSSTPSVASAVTDAVLSKTLPGYSFAKNLSVSRAVAIVLGLILIGGGIIMFRPVGTYAKEFAGGVAQGGKEAAKAAAVA